MPTVVQFRRGTTAQNDAFTGAVGEISVDTEKDTLRVHDGSTAGGFELLQRNLTNQTIGGNVVPDTDSAYDLGSPSNKWRSLYLSGQTIYLGDATISASGTTVVLPSGSSIEGAGSVLDSASSLALLSGGTGVTYNGSGEFSIGQDVATTANVTFGTVETTGNVTVGGNLTVNGTTTTINSTTLEVDDLNITVASGAADATAANGAGLTVDGANATITYVSATDTWDFNKAFGTGTNVISNYTTTQLTEGDNLYYTRARFDSALGDATSQSTIRGYFSAGGDLSYNPTTGEFSFDVENVYTQANFDSDFNTSLDAAAIGGIGLTYNSTTNTLSIDSAELAAYFSTDDITEGSNLYYTTGRADSDARNAVFGGTGISYTPATGTIETNDAQIVHDNLSGFVANEHIDHSQVTMTAGNGLTGGGDITATRTFNIGEGTGITVSADAISTNDGEIVHDNLSGFVANEHIDHTSVTLTAGAGLTGGGDITTSRTFNIGQGTGITVSADTISTNDGEIVHDNLSGFVADEHVAHTGVTLTAGVGLNGGGDISASREFNIDSAELYANFAHDDFHDYVADEHVAHTGVTLTAGVGLNGGGNIAASREFNIDSAELYANFAHDDFHDYVADEHVAHSGVSVVAGSGLTGGGTIEATRTLNIGQGTGITVSADAISTNDGEIVHDNLSGFVADEHIDHTTVSVTAGAGLTGGGTIAATRTLNIGQGTGITVSADAISTNDAQIVHDNLSGFVADEHVAHSDVTLTAGVGLNGGGNIASSRTFNIDSAELYANFAHDDFHDYVANEHIDHTTVSVTAGAGLTGGGTIAASRTLNIGEGTGITVSADAISTNDGEIVHDNLSGFVADEHVAHSGVTMTAGNGLTGGGTIAASRTFNVGAGTGVTVSADAVSIGQDVATSADVTFATVTTTGNVTIGGDLQVQGTTTTINSENYTVTDNMIYMNAGESSGSPTLSVDVGWAANVNDGGSYTHVGMFRDATDDRFKVFGAYTPEPDAALEINTGHASFALADFQAATFHGNLTGNVTGNLTGDVTGNASTATALETARTIGGVSFDGTANINLPGVNTAGNQNTSGNAATATALETARTIGLTGDVTATGVSFDGTGNITLTTAMAANSVDLGTHTTGNYVADGATSGNGISGSVSSEGGTFTVTSNATNANTGSTIVFRDASGNFSAGTITAALSGNATTATTLQTARTINGTSFNGSANITVEPYIEDDAGTNATRYLTFVDNSTAGYKRLNEDANLSYNPSTNTLTTTTFAGALSGNASTATKLATARSIALTGDVTGSTSFDGSGNVSIAATIAANSVALGTDTTGNYAAAVAAGNAITVNGSAGEGTTFTVNHADTSSQASVNNAGGTVIQDVTLDTYGHVTGLVSYNLDGRYYTETEADDRFVNVTGDTMTGSLIPDTPGDYDQTAITSLTNAPINYPEVNVGTSDTYLPALHMRALHSGGYRTHMNVGLHKDASAWGNSSTGFYVALGGNDNNPTEAYKLTYGGEINHTSAGRFFADNYHPNADKLTTARTISIAGDATGSASFDGSANASISISLAANTVTSSELSGATSLTIYNSAGTALKTLYGAGS